MTRDSLRRAGVILSVGLALLFVVGPCLGSTAPDIPTEQLILANRLLATLHEAIVAARAPPTWRIVFFLAALLLPVCGALWLVRCARQDAVTHDEEIRTLVRYGQGEPLVRSYLEEETRRKEALQIEGDSQTGLSVRESSRLVPAPGQVNRPGILHRAWARVTSLFSDS